VVVAGPWIAGGGDTTWEGRAHRLPHPYMFWRPLLYATGTAGSSIREIFDMSHENDYSRPNWSPAVSVAVASPYRHTKRSLVVVVIVRRGSFWDR